MASWDCPKDEIVEAFRRQRGVAQTIVSEWEGESLAQVGVADDAIKRIANTAEMRAQFT